MEGPLFRFSLRRGLDKDSAMEAAHITFVKLWQKIARDRASESPVEPITDLPSFLFRVARNTAVDHLRAQERHDRRQIQVGLAPQGQDGTRDEQKPTDPTLAHARVSFDRPTESGLMRNLDAQALAAALQHIKPHFAQILRLHMEGLSHSEIADALEITEQNVRVRFFRARQAVREHFEAANR